ncbi:hypothetical protein WA026_011867 [Henosepilachna vigintioctopunctata]|uniref:Uncharacterized protein n=1 Tax=Henosepilachna vigintioctopunctata TaxID=420089 RepID=A0AAW1UIH0_9CUCU
MHEVPGTNPDRNFFRKDVEVKAYEVSGTNPAERCSTSTKKYGLMGKQPGDGVGGRSWEMFMTKKYGLMGKQPGVGAGGRSWGMFMMSRSQQT